MRTLLRVVAVVDAPIADVQRASALVAPPVASRAVPTPAGVVLTLERPTRTWRRGATLRELEALLRRVLDRLPAPPPATGAH